MEPLPLGGAPSGAAPSCSSLTLAPASSSLRSSSESPIAHSAANRSNYISIWTPASSTFDDEGMTLHFGSGRQGTWDACQTNPNGRCVPPHRA
jgi:hypothetical protein